MNENKVTLGAQIGSPQAGEATNAAVLSLRRLLEIHCNGVYSSVIGEFAIILRVSGAIWHFEGEGVQRLRINRKEAYITADFVMPETRWEEMSLSKIKRYLAVGVLDTLEAMCEHLKKKKIEVDKFKLTADANQAVSVFLCK